MVRSFIGLGVLAFIQISCASGAGSRADIQSEPMDERASIQYDFAFDSYVNGDLIPALGSAMRAVEMSPHNPEARNLLGLIYFRQGKSGLAEAEFKKSGEIDPKMSEAFNNLGSVYLSQNRYEDARKALLKAQDNPLYLYPERIQNNLGLAYMGLKNSEEAETAFLEAIRLNKKFYLPYINLGRMLVEQNQVAKAEPLIREAAKLCSECSEPRYILGDLYMKQNKKSEARELFKQGATVDPEGYFGKLCSEQLARK